MLIIRLFLLFVILIRILCHWVIVIVIKVVGGCVHVHILIHELHLMICIHIHILRHILHLV